MAIRFKCQHCQKKLEVKDQLAGKKAKCPICKNDIVIPQPTTPPAQDGATRLPAPTKEGPPANGSANGNHSPEQTKAAPATTAPAQARTPATSVPRVEQQPAPNGPPPGKPAPPRQPGKGIPVGKTVPARGTAPAKTPAAPGQKKGPQAETAPTAPKPAPQENIDVDALAAEAFADEPKVEEPREQKTIEMVCMFCDEKIVLDIELSGKKTQCPKCRNLIQVDKVEVEKKKDWREMGKNTGLPTLARINQAERLEGTWDAGEKSKVSTTSLEDAGALPEQTQPVGVFGWSKRVFYSLVVVGCLVGIYFGLMILVNRKREQDALAKVMAARLDIPEVAGPVHRSLGEFYARAGKARKSLNHFRSAVASNPGKPGLDRDLLLTEVAVGLLALGTDNEFDANAGTHLLWGKVQEDLDRALRAMSSSETRLLALREVATRLLERNQGNIAAGLARAINDTKDPLLSAGEVAVLLALKQADKAKTVFPPPTGKENPLAPPVRLGYAEGRARTGDFTGARAVVNQNANLRSAAQDRLRALLAVAEVAYFSKNTTEATTLLGEVRKLVDEQLKKTRLPVVTQFQIGRLVAALDSPEVAREYAATITDPAIKGCVQAEIVRRQVSEGKETEAAEVKETKSLAYARALLQEARWKAEQGRTNDVRVLEEREEEGWRAIIFAGRALGEKAKQE